MKHFVEFELEYGQRILASADSEATFKVTLKWTNKK